MEDKYLKFIDSKDMQKYYKEANIELDDEIIYYLILKSSFTTLSEKHEALRNLYDKTKNVELKSQISINLNRDNIMIKLFQKDEPGYVYKVDEWFEQDREYEFESYYSSYKLAFKAIENYDKCANKIRIEKIRSISSFEEVEKYPLNEIILSDSNYNRITVEYNLNKEILEIFGHFIGQEEYNIDDPIEERWHKIPHMYKKGDIIKYIRNSTKDTYIGVITDISDRGESRLSHNSILPPVADASDIGFTIYMITNRGNLYFADHPVNPLDINYYKSDIELDTEDFIWDSDQTLLDRTVGCFSMIVNNKIIDYELLINLLHKLHEQYDEENIIDADPIIYLKKSTLNWLE